MAWEIKDREICEHYRMSSDPSSTEPSCSQKLAVIECAIIKSQGKVQTLGAQTLGQWDSWNKVGSNSDAAEVYVRNEEINLR